MGRYVLAIQQATESERAAFELRERELREAAMTAIREASRVASSEAADEARQQIGAIQQQLDVAAGEAAAAQTKLLDMDTAQSTLAEAQAELGIANSSLESWRRRGYDLEKKLFELARSTLNADRAVEADCVLKLLAAECDVASARADASTRLSAAESLAARDMKLHGDAMRSLEAQVDSLTEEVETATVVGARTSIRLQQCEADFAAEEQRALALEINTAALEVTMQQTDAVKVAAEAQLQASESEKLRLDEALKTQAAKAAALQQENDDLKQLQLKLEDTLNTSSQALNSNLDKHAASMRALVAERDAAELERVRREEQLKVTTAAEWQRREAALRGQLSKQMECSKMLLQQREMIEGERVRLEDTLKVEVDCAAVLRQQKDRLQAELAGREVASGQMLQLKLEETEEKSEQTLKNHLSKHNVGMKELVAERDAAESERVRLGKEARVQADKATALQHEHERLQADLAQRVKAGENINVVVVELRAQLKDSEQESEQMLKAHLGRHNAAMQELIAERDAAEGEKARLGDALKQELARGAELQAAAEENSVAESIQILMSPDSRSSVPAAAEFSMADAEREATEANALLEIALEEERAANTVASRAIELVQKVKNDKDLLLAEANLDTDRMTTQLEEANRLYVEVDADRRELASSFAHVVADAQRQKIETNNAQKIVGARAELESFMSDDGDFLETSATYQSSPGQHSFFAMPASTNAVRPDKPSRESKKMIDSLTQERLALAKEVTDLAKEAALTKQEGEKLRMMLNVPSTAEIPQQLQRVQEQLESAEADHEETNLALMDAERRLREFESGDEDRIEERIEELKAQASLDANALREAEGRLRQMEADEFDNQTATDQGINAALQHVATLEGRAQQSEAAYLELSDMLISAEQRFSEYESTQNELLRSNEAKLAEMSMHSNQLVCDVTYLTAELDAVTALVEAVPKVTEQQNMRLKRDVVALTAELDAATSLVAGIPPTSTPPSEAAEPVPSDEHEDVASATAEFASQLAQEFEEQLHVAREQIERNEDSFLQERARAEEAEFAAAVATEAVASAEQHTLQLTQDVAVLATELEAVTALVDAVQPTMTPPRGPGGMAAGATEAAIAAAAAESVAAAESAIATAAAESAAVTVAAAAAESAALEQARGFQEQLHTACIEIEHKEEEVLRERTRAEEAEREAACAADAVGAAEVQLEHLTGTVTRITADLAALQDLSASESASNSELATYEMRVAEAFSNELDVSFACSRKAVLAADHAVDSDSAAEQAQLKADSESRAADSESRAADSESRAARQRAEFVQLKRQMTALSAEKDAVDDDMSKLRSELARANEEANLAVEARMTAERGLQALKDDVDQQVQGRREQSAAAPVVEEVDQVLQQITSRRGAWLHKRSDGKGSKSFGNLKKKWDLRYFNITDIGTLEWSQSEAGDGSNTAVMDLRNAQVVRRSEKKEAQKGYKPRIKIVSDSRVLTVSCEQEYGNDERRGRMVIDAFADVVEQAISQAKREQNNRGSINRGSSSSQNRDIVSTGSTGGQPSSNTAVTPPKPERRRRFSLTQNFKKKQ